MGTVLLLIKWFIYLLLTEVALLAIYYFVFCREPKTGGKENEKGDTEQHDGQDGR